MKNINHLLFICVFPYLFSLFLPVLPLLSKSFPKCFGIQKMRPCKNMSNVSVFFITLYHQLYFTGKSSAQNTPDGKRKQRDIRSFFTPPASDSSSGQTTKNNTGMFYLKSNRMGDLETIHLPWNCICKTTFSLEKVINYPCIHRQLCRTVISYFQIIPNFLRDPRSFFLFFFY